MRYLILILIATQTSKPFWGKTQRQLSTLRINLYNGHKRQGTEDAAPKIQDHSKSLQRLLQLKWYSENSVSGHRHANL